VRAASNPRRLVYNEDFGENVEPPPVMTLQVRLIALSVAAGGALAACGGGGGSSGPANPSVLPSRAPTSKPTQAPSATPSPSPTPVPTPTPTASPTPATVTVSPTAITFTGPSTPGNVTVSGGVPPYTYDETFCLHPPIAEVTSTPPPSQNPAVYEISYGTSLGTCQITFTDTKKSKAILTVTNEYNPG
jgi:hypothetical protein